MSTIENKNEVLDLTKVGISEEKKVSILPPALLAAKALNKRNVIGIQEVHLPVMNTVIKCYPISNIDDIMIKTISGSISAYNEANLKLFYNHCEFKPEAGAQTFELFISKLTEADFRTMLYGIMTASFKSLDENRFICKNEKCPNPDENKVFDFTPSMKNINISFPQAPFVSPSNDHTKDLFIAETDIMKINYRFCTLEDKIERFKQKSNDEIRKNLIEFGIMLPKTELTIDYIDSVEIAGDDAVYNISNPEDIKLFISALDVTSREEIEKLNDKFISFIDGWIPTFSTEIVCPHCKNSQNWGDIDIYVEFFRKFTAIF